MAREKPNVSELAAMFGNKDLEAERAAFPNKSEFRKRPPPGGTKPAHGSKPTFGSKTISSDNVFERRRPFNRNATSQSTNSDAPKSPEKSAFKSSSGSTENSPKHETKANGDILRNKTNYTPHNITTANTGSYQTEKSWKKEIDSKMDDNNEKTDHNEAQTSYPPPQRNSFLSDRRISSTSSIGESVKSSQSDKAASNAENEFPSGGSFTSADARDVTWKRKQSDDADSSKRSSFLHHSPTPSVDLASGSTDRRRRALPSRIFNEAPPQKPRRPLHAKLPNQQQASSIPAARRGDSFLSRQQRPTQTPVGDDGRRKSDAPVLPGGHPNAPANFNHPPSLPSRNLPSQEPPSLPGRHPTAANTTSIHNRPVPTPPGSQTGSASGSFGTALPDRPPPPLPGGPPDTPIGQRSLPSLPNGRSMPPSHDDRPPLPPPDSRRDSTPQSPPPSANSSSLHRQPSIIKTWDDEEEGLYDDTPGESAPARPPLPPVDNNRGGNGLPAIPQENEIPEDGEIYEPIEVDIDRTPNLPPPPPKDDDKKKKDAEKKDKEMRKKFKLPMIGEIAAQTTGSIKSDSKWFDKFTVKAGDAVDIIRTAENPKGKWLVRTMKGTYGYVDSVNIQLDLSTVRRTMKAAENTRRDSVDPPPLPPINSPYRPAFDPPLGDEEAVYDETAEEELLYEEL